MHNSELYRSSCQKLASLCGFTVLMCFVKHSGHGDIFPERPQGWWQSVRDCCLRRRILRFPACILDAIWLIQKLIIWSVHEKKHEKALHKLHNVPPFFFVFCQGCGWLLPGYSHRAMPWWRLEGCCFRRWSVSRQGGQNWQIALGENMGKYMGLSPELPSIIVNLIRPRLYVFCLFSCVISSARLPLLCSGVVYPLSERGQTAGTTAPYSYNCSSAMGWCDSRRQVDCATKIYHVFGGAICSVIC